MGWEAIAVGARREAAERALQQTLDAARQQPKGPPGAAESALVWHYVADYTNDADAEQRRDQAIEKMIELVELRGSGLFGGLAGSGFALSHLVDQSVEPVLAEIDRGLGFILDEARWPYEVDLISGVAGVGVYLLERARQFGLTDQVRALLARVYELLRAPAMTDEHGIYWQHPPELMHGWQAKGMPKGKVDCGISHGVPGLAVVMAEIESQQLVEAGAARAAIEWTYRQRLSDPRNVFPAMWEIGSEARRPARTAWCYGDLGIAIGFWRAHQMLGASCAREHALLTAVCGRPATDLGITDTCVCHGTAGMLHLLNRAYQATGDNALLASAHHWLDALTEDPLAGIFASDRPHPLIPGLLEGPEGIALTLIAALSTTEPLWDRLLLTDLPVR